MWTGLRSMSMRDVLRTNRADTVPEPYEPDGLVAENPAAPTISRRGALALVGGGALFIAVITAGQTLGGFTRKAALLLPRGRTRGDGPNDFQVNRTAWAAGITPEPPATGGGSPCPAGRSTSSSDRATLSAMPQHTARLPIACVEGWSTTETWTGVRLARARRDWRACPNPTSAFVRSVERRGGFNRATLQANQVDPPGFPSGAACQRRRPVTRSRLSGSDHRPWPAGSAQHQMGRAPSSSGRADMRTALIDSARCTDRIRCTC